jgi:hypothetical protein
VSTPDTGAAATPTAYTSNTCPSDSGIQPIDGEVLQYGVILIIDESSLDGLGREPQDDTKNDQTTSLSTRLRDFMEESV